MPGFFQIERCSRLQSNPRGHDRPWHARSLKNSGVGVPTGETPPVFPRRIECSLQNKNWRNDGPVNWIAGGVKERAKVAGLAGEIRRRARVFAEGVGDTLEHKWNVISGGNAGQALDARELRFQVVPRIIAEIWMNIGEE